MMSEQVLTPSPPSFDELLIHIQNLDGCGPDTQIASFAEGAHNLVLRGINGPAGFEDFVVRYAKHPAHDGMLRKEARARAFIGDQAPRIWQCGRLASGRSILLQEYIPGQPRHFNDLNEQEIGNFAVTLSEVHAVVRDRFSGRSGDEPSCCEGTYEDYLWAMIHESVYVRLSHYDVSPYPEAVNLLGQGLRYLRHHLDKQANHFRKPNQPFSLQHHDCNEDNVLWCPDGTIKLIDWNATFGDPVDELAYVFTDNHCSQSFKKEFLKRYLPPEGSGDILARIPAYVLKNLLDDLAWAIEMRELHPGKERWISVYQERLANLTRFLQEDGTSAQKLTEH